MFGLDTSQVKGWKHCFIQIGLKFVASLFPIIVAMFVSNLVYILKYAGLIAFLVVFFIPILFQLSSQWISYNTFDYMVVANDEQDMNIKNRSSKELELMSVKGKEEEEEKLLPGQGKETVKRVLEFIFTCKNTFLYKTPYSTFLGHPLGVIFILLLAVVCFLLTVISLFVHPTNTSCI